MKDSAYIEYSEGCKYYLRSDLIYNTGIKGYRANTDYISLMTDGTLILKKGFPWDGASGPTVDTKSSIRGSAVHDALYSLCRLGYLPRSLQKKFDDILEKINIEDGMWKVRASIWEKVLNKFGRSNLYPSKERQILRAP